MPQHVPVHRRGGGHIGPDVGAFWPPLPVGVPESIAAPPEATFEDTGGAHTSPSKLAARVLPPCRRRTTTG